ncbi:MAG: hypothetical protein ACXW3C_17285, partial [Pyrinomonadaceae bacterium]
MDRQAFKTLEFDSLRALVRRQATTEMARARIDQLEPIARAEDLRYALDCVAEMIEARQAGMRLSFEGIADLSEPLAHLKIQGTALEPLTMLGLARLCVLALD